MNFRFLVLIFVAVALGLGACGESKESAEKAGPPSTDAVEEEKAAGEPEPEPTPTRGIDELLEKMELGVVAFNTPTHINIEDSSQIQLLLSLADTVEELKRSIAEEGEKAGATVRVTD